MKQSDSYTIVLNSNTPIKKVLLLWKDLEELYQLESLSKKDGETVANFFNRHFFIPIPPGEDPRSFFLDLQSEGLLLDPYLPPEVTTGKLSSDPTEAWTITTDPAEAWFAEMHYEPIRNH